jgi:hypothetical protein
MSTKARQMAAPRPEVPCRPGAGSEGRAGVHAGRTRAVGA